MARLRVLSVSAFLIFFPCIVHAQVDVPTDRIVWFHPDQEVRVANLPSLTAPDSSSVLATALETVLHDKAVCCGKDSALEDAVPTESLPFRELSGKLQGRYRLSDSRPIVVNAEYIPQSSITAGVIVAALRDQHAPLIEWKSYLYVLYGVIFNETLYSSGRRLYAVHKLLLLDTRFSDQRKETEFNRETDDLGTVQGLLTLSVAQQ